MSVVFGVSEAVKESEVCFFVSLGVFFETELFGLFFVYLICICLVLDSFENVIKIYHANERYQWFDANDWNILCYEGLKVDTEYLEKRKNDLE